MAEREQAVSRRWKPGFPAPKGVDADAAWQACGKLRGPKGERPKRLLEASKKPSHVLHRDLWSEPDSVWAERGRLERCRKIIASIEEVHVKGGKTIVVRSIECVTVGGVGQWENISDIVKDPALLEAHLGAIQNLQEQAVEKMEALRALIRP